MSGRASDRDTLEAALDAVLGINPCPPDEEASAAWSAIVAEADQSIGDLISLLDIWEVLAAGRRPIRRAVSTDGDTMVLYLDSAGRVVEKRMLGASEDAEGNGDEEEGMHEEDDERCTGSH